MVGAVFEGEKKGSLKKKKKGEEEIASKAKRAKKKKGRGWRATGTTRAERRLTG